MENLIQEAPNTESLKEASAHNKELSSTAHHLLGAAAIRPGMPPSAQQAQRCRHHRIEVLKQTASMYEYKISDVYEMLQGSISRGFPAGLTCLPVTPHS